MVTDTAVPAGRAYLASGWGFPLLGSVLAVALVLDQLWWGGFEITSRHGVVVLAALVVLVRPSSVARWAVLLGADVVSVAADMPAVGTHRLLALVVESIALLHLVTTIARTRRIPTPKQLVGELAPFLRVSLLVVYAASALAKLNTSFLDPATSCALPSARRLLAGEAGALDDPRLAWAVIGGTVAMEAGLPVLLAWRRTRLAGVVLGLGFHTVLALAGNVPFSALVGVFYVAFLPADTGTRLRAVVPALRPPGRTIRRALGGALVLVLVGGWLAGAALGLSDPAPGLTAPPSALVAPALGDALRAATAALLLGGAALLLVSRWRAPDPPRYPDRALHLRHPVLVLGLALLIANAACPYVGSKTDTSFEMFSGLRTEPGAWNSVVVPEAARLFSSQDGAGQVIAASDPALVARTSAGRRILPAELDRALAAHPGSTALVRTDTDPTPLIVGPRPPGRTVGSWGATWRDPTPVGVPRC